MQTPNACTFLETPSIVGQAERFCSAPAKHAATARYRNDMRSARRDRSQPLNVDGINAPWRTLFCSVAVPELSSVADAPREEFTCSNQRTAGGTPGYHSTS